MLTAEKVEIYKSYKGYYDGYYIQNKTKSRVISDEEWFMLDNFIQDIYLIRKQVAAKSFEIELLRRLNENCDNEDTCKLVFELEKYLNE